MGDIRIQDLLTERPADEMSAWMPFKYGVEVLVQYLGKDTLQEITRKATRWEWDDSHTRTERVREDLLIKYLSDYVLDWRGLDGKALEKLLPVKVAEDQLDVEIPCNKENKITMLTQCYDFDVFLRDAITSMDRIREAQREAELKNLSTLSHRG